MSKKTVLDKLRDIQAFPKSDRANVQKPRQAGKSKPLYDGFALGMINARAVNTGVGKPKRRLSLRTQKPFYKELFEMSRDMMKKHNPNFKFSSIQYNKNHRSERHKDKRNQTDSYIIGLGDYTGGDLRIWSEDEKTYKDINIKNRWFRFNGAARYHETLPFSGERYSLVFYTT